MYYILKTKDKNIRVEQSEYEKLIYSNIRAKQSFPLMSGENITGDDIQKLIPCDTPKHYICDECRAKALKIYRSEGKSFEEASKMAKESSRVPYNSICECESSNLSLEIEKLHTEHSKYKQKKEDISFMEFIKRKLKHQTRIMSFAK